MLNVDSFCPLIKNKCRNHECKWYVRKFTDLNGVKKWDCVVVDIAQSLERAGTETNNND